MRNEEGVGIGKIIAIIVAVVIIVAAIASISNLFENLDARQVMVIQSPIKGNLSWYTTPGIKWQGFGRVTKYQKRDQYWFSAKSDQGDKLDQSIKVRFNDGGHAQLSGSLSWEMPLDETNLTRLHTQYGSMGAIDQQLIRTVTEKSVYMTGPLMSSKESYAERRNELLQIIEEQIQIGVFQTETKEQKATDPMSGQMKTIIIVKIKVDKDGKPIRSEESPLSKFGIKIFNVSINEVKYVEEVENQIKLQQQATMQVQIAVAQAKEAEQKAITTEKEGQAAAMKTKWEQEAIRAKAVVEADQKKEVAVIDANQKLEVAKLDKQSAEQFKMAETLRGEGEAARRRLVMEADGALAIKLQTYLEVNKVYADAISHYTGNWVPSIVMGGTAGPITGSGASQLIDLLTAKTAKDLSLDLSVPAASKPAPPPQSPQK